MSLAVFTDSTTAQASPLLILRPTSGSSTKTRSVSSCCAWSVMPTVAVSPATRTHSWNFVYFKPEGTLLINFFTADYADGADSQIHFLVGTSRRDVTARAAAGGTNALWRTTHPIL